MNSRLDVIQNVFTNRTIELWIHSIDANHRKNLVVHSLTDSKGKSRVTVPLEMLGVPRLVLVLLIVI